MNTTTQPGPLEVRLSDQLGQLVERLLRYSDIRRNDPRENRETLRDLILGELRDELEAERRAERERCRPDGLMFDALGEPRTRYVRVTLNGSHCVMDPSEGDCYVEEARNAGDPDWERYIVRDVWLSEREFQDLPEHDGF